MSKVFKEEVDKNVIDETRYFISLVELGSYCCARRGPFVTLTDEGNRLL